MRASTLRLDWALDWRVAALHLFALWGLAVVQPLLDVTSKKGEFFIALEVGGWPLAAFAVLLAVAPPALMLALELLAGRAHPMARAGLHLGLMLLLLSLGAIYALKDRFPNQSWLLVWGGLGLGLIATLLYARLQFVRSLTSVLAAAPVLFIALFLLDSPARMVVFEPELRPPSPAELAATRAAQQTPVVMLMIDEVPISTFMRRDGTLDERRFPHLSRLSRGSTWYRNTVAAADYTIRAIPAIVSGKSPGPADDRVPLAADHPDTVFRLLAGTHRMVVSEYATELCPASLCRPARSRLSRATRLPAAYAGAIPKVLLPDVGLELPPLGLTFGDYDRVRDPRSSIDVDGATRGELAKHGGVQFERFLRLVDRNARGEKPPFIFFHAVLPHLAWKYLPSGRLMTGEYSGRTQAFNEDGTWVRQRPIIRHFWQRHMLQTMYTDRLIGRLVSRLRRHGLYDRALFVVIGDHGNSFRSAGHRRTVTARNSADIGMVPLFIKAPYQRRGRTSDKFLQTTDVLPTMAQLLGVRIPWGTDGQPASALPPAGRDRIVIARDRPGPGLEATADLLSAQRSRTLSTQARLFGRRSLYRLGPRPDLIGSRVAALGAPPGAGRVTLDFADDYLDVDPDSRYIPALVTGRLTGAGAGAHQLAIAVNGRIAATTTSYRADERVLFASVVPPRTLRPGRNRVEVLAIDGPRLRPLGGT